MKHVRLSIHDIQTLILTGLALMVLLPMVQGLWQSFQRLDRIHSLKEATALSDKLFDATEKLALERDVSLSILYAPNAEIIQELQPRLDDSRQGAGEALRDTLQELQKYDIAELITPARDSEAQIMTIQKLRRQIDRAILLPAGERKQELSEHCFDEITGLIQQTQALWAKFAKYYMDIDPIVTQHMQFKQALSVIMEYTGRSRSLIGRLIVENAAPTSKDQTNLLQWKGAADLGWERSAMMARHGGIYESIEPYYKDAKSHHFTLHDMVRDSFYVPGVRVSSYPITIEFWLELTTQASDSLYALHEASQKKTREFIEAIEAEAFNEIWVRTGLFLLALLICVYCFRVLQINVMKPISDMLATLIAAVEYRKLSGTLTPAKQREESDKMLQMLNDFKNVLE